MAPKTRALFLIVASFFSTFSSMSAADERYGKFEGKLVAEFLPDGRNVELVEKISFIDSKARAWEVPRGSQTNGASIPQVLWIAYPPFTGKYRMAAVIHDHYCVTKERTWQQVHRMFYDAMRAVGVDARLAKSMYAAVYAFGPRWEGTGRTRAVSVPNLMPQEKQLAIFSDLQKWIDETNPTPEEIRERVRSMKLD